MKNRTYTKNFKLEVMSELNSGKTFTQISSEKGIAPSTIHKWKKEFSQDRGNAFSGTQKIKSLESELKGCKNAIGELYLEVAFLKDVRINLQNLLTQQKMKELEGYKK